MMTDKNPSSNKSRSSLRLKVIKTIDENGLLDNAKSVLLGFSGGVDSSVLFDVLLTLRGKYSFTLYALHVNHMIRGEESDSDEDFVRRTCEANGVKLFVFHADVPALCRESGKSLELAARDARYEAFERTAKENGIDVIATAHNADDNAETVLYDLIKGTYLKGMSGIPYKRGNIIRPLRDVTRKEIDEYASEFGVSHVFDSTNAIPDCSRNKLRLEIIPLIKEINPSFSETLLNTSRNFALLSDFVDESASKAGDDLSSCHPAVISSVIISECGKLERETLKKAINAVREKKNVTFDAEGGRKLVVSDGRVKICESERTEKCGRVEYLCLEDGENHFGPLTTVFLNVSKNSYDFNKFSTTVTLCSAKISGKIYARSRNEGDGIRINGITKSLKKEFINKKIPKEYRDAIPVICSGDTVIAVPFVGVADGYRAGDGEKNRFSVCFGFDISDKSIEKGR